ncbi:ADP-ribosylglycohydrolase family protein [Nocardiopsis sp. CT-R113]|uniref:ADP-ribosylglycohydrolase family protein n=1 Tax=Nocardiopsis codii TaxID=3065942 RepID=A0ABU7K595_9ACTN|nr:ADP-ribosylglycohydrolase family protein [Nocardiopsis sp. CT-R113]MEE2037412.1 ADP-ribosylglycohydrolase family protein [Nocardiopsis sp. CT-R113]
MRSETARGALLGLAMGDALGLPAQFHRRVRSGWGRDILWQKNAELDRQRVSRPLLPFALTGDEGSPLSGTDDAETAATAALVLLEAEGHDTASLFARWRAHYADTEGVWCGVAERGAVVHALRGEVPPTTGTDNPVHWDDAAVPAAVVIGLFHSGDTEAATRLAGDYASITHARDGLWAARAMAHAVASLAAGAPLAIALEGARRTVPADSWLGRGLARADALASGATDAFTAVPDLVDAFGRSRYSHGGVAPETLPAAFAITRLVDGDLAAGLQAAALLPRQADSMPAMVGALCGAVGGERSVPASWRERVDRLDGVLLPRVAGLRLTELADRLVAAESGAVR